MDRRVGDILHPERESKDALDRIKAEIGSLHVLGPVSAAARSS